MKKSSIITILIILITIISSLNVKNINVNINRLNYHGKNVYRASYELINKANSVKVSNYQDGNKHQMYSFEMNNSIIDYRFIGRQSYNYIYFNCNNENNCELWRIIGVFKVEDANGIFKYRIKIMRNDSIGKFRWSDEANNDWNSSLINEELNNNYYNSLDESTKNLIWSTKFNVNSFDINSINEKNLYDLENNNAIKNSYNFGLIYPSDYIYTYSLGAINENQDNPNYNKSWMYKIKDNNAWTMLQSSNLNHVYISNGDSISLNDNLDDEFDVYPVAYLKYNIVISNGDGSLRNPYKIESMNNSNIQDESELKNENDLKQVVKVDDTFSGLSLCLILLSSICIVGGLLFLGINYYKSRKIR